MTEDRFNVVSFDRDGYWHYVARDLDARKATEIAKACVDVAEVTGLPATGLVEVARVIITDADDFTCFDWRRGEGVVFPPRQGEEPPGPPGAGSGGSRGPTPDLEHAAASVRPSGQDTLPDGMTGRRRRRAPPARRLRRV